MDTPGLDRLGHLLCVDAKNKSSMAREDGLSLMRKPVLSGEWSEGFRQSPAGVDAATKIADEW